MRYSFPFPTHRGVAVSAIAIAAGIGFLLARPVKGGSIFDDDFVPPTRSAPTSPTPRPQPTPTPAPTPGPKTDSTPTVPNDASATPKPPPAAVPAIPSETPTLPARRAIPSSPEQAKCRKLLKEAFADQLKDKTAPARRKLTKVLLDEAAKTPSTPVDYFVLLTGALESAEESGSLGRSFIAIDELAKSYDVDELAIKADAVAKVWGAGRQSPGTVANVQAAFDVVDQLVADDDFAGAGRIESLLQRGIGGIADSELKSAVAGQIRNFEATHIEHDRLVPTLEKLKTSPADPAANYALGSYLCFTREQWERGLPLLARGSEPAIKALAETELRKSANAEETAALADDWSAAAAKFPPPAKDRILQHASILYRTALAGLSGLRRVAAEKHIADLPSPGKHRRIDLLDIVDPAVDTRNGKWRLEEGTLICEPRDGTTNIEFPTTAPDEYDFRIGFTVIKGNEVVAQICTGAGHQFNWFMGGWGNAFCGFDVINGVGANQNKTAKRSKRWLNNGQHYVSVVKVRSTGVEAYLNDQLISSWKTDYSDMAMWENWQMHRKDTIGLGTGAQMFMRFDLAELIEITGKAKSTR